MRDPGEFAPRFSEIRGDVYAAMGDTDAAVDAYTDALLSSGNGTIDTEYVQLKLNDLVQAGIADSAESAESEDDG